MLWGAACKRHGSAEGNQLKLHQFRLPAALLCTQLLQRLPRARIFRLFRWKASVRFIS